MPLLPSTILLLCWLQLFNQLRVIWSANEQYGYGWFVPFVAVGLLWRRWQSRPAPEVSGLWSVVHGHRSAVRSQPFLLSAFCFLLFFLLLPFRVLEMANPGWFVLLWVHALTVLGISLGALFLWGGAPALRQYWFPFCFLLTSVVWPSKIEALVINGLMNCVAQVTLDVVGLFDIPALRKGAVLTIANGDVAIDEACSGVRSLQTSIMLALFLGELFRVRPWKRVLLVPCGMLVALAANVGRTSFLTWSAARQGFERMEAWHGPAGFAVVVVVFGSACLLAWLWRERQEPEVKGQRSVVRGPWSAVSRPPSLPLPAGFLMLCCLWIPTTEGLTWGWYRWPGKGLTAAAPWCIKWPTNQMDFVETPLPERTVSILGCAVHRSVSWRDAEGFTWNVIALYWPPQGEMDAYVGGHNPERCLRSSGLTFLRRVQPAVVRVGTVSIHFRHMLFSKGNQEIHVFQGTWEPFVPPQGQRLFGSTSLSSRINNVLDRRIIRGGTTLELVVMGPTTYEEAASALQRQMEKLIVDGIDNGKGGL